MSAYRTIETRSESLYKEKGSKFLAFAFPVGSEDEIKNCQEELRKEYYDARHHCFAWRLGLSEQVWRSNDDGEPSHSAGDPILGQIRSFDLTNVLVVVVRYFGGTKLGVGGLINAYKTATEYALNKAKTIEIFEEVKLELKFPYEILSTVERVISDLEIKVVNRNFQLDCRINANIKKDSLESLNNRIKDLYNFEMSTGDS